MLNLHVCTKGLKEHVVITAISLLNCAINLYLKMLFLLVNLCVYKVNLLLLWSLAGGLLENCFVHFTLKIYIFSPFICANAAPPPPPHTHPFCVWHFLLLLVYSDIAHHKNLKQE